MSILRSLILWFTLLCKVIVQTNRFIGLNYDKSTIKLQQEIDKTPVASFIRKYIKYSEEALTSLIVSKIKIHEK